MGEIYLRKKFLTVGGGLNIYWVIQHFSETVEVRVDMLADINFQTFSIFCSSENENTGSLVFILAE